MPGFTSYIALGTSMEGESRQSIVSVIHRRNLQEEMGRGGKWGHRALIFIRALDKLVPLVSGTWKGKQHLEA